jgi:hypothetical protein
MKYYTRYYSTRIIEQDSIVVDTNYMRVLVKG